MKIFRYTLQLQRKDTDILSKAQKNKVILSIVAISFTQGLQYCISPVLRQIGEYYFDVSVVLVQMLVTAPALIAMLVALISGWLVVKVSVKKLLLFGSFVAGAAGLVPFLADSFGLLFASRILYGVGLGLATALNLSVVVEFFTGDERVRAMGIQAASIGAGMVASTTVGGILGQNGFQNAYFTHIIAFVSTIVIAVCLPDTGKVKMEKTEKIRINGSVIKYSIFGLLEFLFLITFTTNIAMHLSGNLLGNTTVSGLLTGIFSGAQIVIGLILGYVTKLAKKYTLPVSMLCFSVGAIILMLFSENSVMLAIGAVFCGFSQGIFVPQAMVEVSNSVSSASATMASAVFTGGACMGQLISPVILNTISKLIFGEIDTTNVYMISAVGMTIAAAIFAVMIKKQNLEEKV